MGAPAAVRVDMTRWRPDCDSLSAGQPPRAITAGCRRSRAAFTLIELLVVVAIIALLTSILVPSLGLARELTRSAICQANLHDLGISMVLYQAENDGYFWPYSRDGAYFWGTPTDPVDKHASAFLKYCDYNLAPLWCRSLPWGTYVPQGGVSEPTTTYGYNAWCLDPSLWGRRDASGKRLPRKRADDLLDPSKLFVFNDSGLYWAPGGVGIFQNSTSMDPVTLGAWGPNQTPTTHFRHNGRSNALLAGGQAGSFGLEGGRMVIPEKNLGFVGAENVPYYDQE